jgi:hypothetical protein
MVSRQQWLILSRYFKKLSVQKIKTTNTCRNASGYPDVQQLLSRVLLYIILVFVAYHTVVWGVVQIWGKNALRRSVTGGGRVTDPTGAPPN